MAARPVLTVITLSQYKGPASHSPVITMRGLGALTCLTCLSLLQCLPIQQEDIDGLGLASAGLRTRSMDSLGRGNILRYNDCGCEQLLMVSCLEPWTVSEKARYSSKSFRNVKTSKSCGTFWFEYWNIITNFRKCFEKNWQSRRRQGHYWILLSVIGYNLQAMCWEGLIVWEEVIFHK